MTDSKDRERILRIALVFVAVASIAIAFLLYRSTAHAPVSTPEVIGK